MVDQSNAVTVSDQAVAAGVPPATPESSTPATPAVEEVPVRRPIWKMILTIIALGAMSGLFLFFPIDWDTVGNWGYLGVFLVTLVATASFILPIPYLLIVARAGMYLNPLLVTLVAGLAGGIGETTG